MQFAWNNATIETLESPIQIAIHKVLKKKQKKNWAYISTMRVWLRN